jgi:YbbR domain-containing protein
MNIGRSARRALAFVFHNWPLKLAAIVLATLLYAGFVVSQDSNVYPGPVRVGLVNQPSGTVLINDLRDVEQIRYIAPADLGRLTAEDFRATVDLANVTPDGSPASVRVIVVAVDPRVTILDFRPQSIQVTLDQRVPKVVDVVVDRGSPPAGLDIGEVTVDPSEVTVTGPSANVNRVVAARASAPIDGSGIDVDREVEVDAIDAAGEIVTGVDIEPRTVHVTIPIFTDKQSRTVPVNPMVAGTPAAGFRIAAIEVEPLVVSIEGDADQLAELVRADTEPVGVFGATSDVEMTVVLALPPGVLPLGSASVKVTVRIEPVTETRTFRAGLRLDGARPGFRYSAELDPILLTLFGSVADLDVLASAPIVIGLNVSALGPGTHEVPVVPSVPSGVTVAAISVETVTVTVREPPTPTPSPEPASPSPSPSPSDGASPSAAP